MGSSLSYPKVNLSGRTALVTGANTGIGYETAKALAAMGANVIVACRSEEKGTAAIERMRTELPDQELGLEFAKLDLDSLAQVKEFAEDFSSRHDSLHLLILNAGIAMPARTHSGDGFGIEYQVNHLSHFLLALLLMPVLLKTLNATQQQGDSAGNVDPTATATVSKIAAAAAETDDAQAATSSPATAAKSSDAVPIPPSTEVRVIFVSSSGHDIGKFILQKLIAGQGDRFPLYCASKLLQVMIAHSLQRHFKTPGLVFHSVHPGTVKTEISRDFSGFWKHITTVMGSVGTLLTPEQGARCTLNAALNPSFDGLPSTYFESCKPKQSSSTSRNETLQAQLWNVSLGHIQVYLSGAADLNIDWEGVEAARKPEFMPPAASTPAVSDTNPSASSAGEESGPASKDDGEAAATAEPAAATVAVAAAGANSDSQASATADIAEAAEAPAATTSTAAAVSDDCSTVPEPGTGDETDGVPAAAGTANTVD